MFIPTFSFRSLNKFIKGRVMGPELAYALFSAIFFKWNKKRQVEDYQHVETPEIFGVGGSSMQAMDSCFDNLVGKWIKQQALASNHFICNFLFTLRKISSFGMEIPNLIEIVAQSPYLVKLFYDGKTVFSGDVDNAANAGFHSRESKSNMVKADPDGVLSISSEEIAKICVNSQYMSRYLKEKGLSSDKEKNLHLLLKHKISTLQSIADFSQIVFILFLPSSVIPVLPFIPFNGHLHIKRIWIFLAFKDGKYFFAEQKDETGEPPLKKNKNGCNCGKSSSNKDGKQFCVDGFSYKSRCPCSKAKNGCQSWCFCVNCNNVHGKRTYFQQKKFTRNRQPPSMSLARKTSLEFLTERNEQATKGKWSDVEYMLLFMLLEKQTSWEVSDIAKSFNTEAKVLSASNMQIDLKTDKQVDAKIKHSEAARRWLKAQCEITFI